MKGRPANHRVAITTSPKRTTIPTTPIAAAATHCRAVKCLNRVASDARLFTDGCDACADAGRSPRAGTVGASWTSIAAGSGRKATSARSETAETGAAGACPAGGQPSPPIRRGRPRRRGVPSPFTFTLEEGVVRELNSSPSPERTSSRVSSKCDAIARVMPVAGHGGPPVTRGKPRRTPARAACGDEADTAFDADRASDAPAEAAFATRVSAAAFTTGGQASPPGVRGSPCLICTMSVVTMTTWTRSPREPRGVEALR